MVGDGEFRQDLWYRLAVFPIHLPPLRERLADVPALAAHFAVRAAGRLGFPALTPTAQDIDLLVEYSWPGNVRELAAVIERAAILGEGKRLEITRALGLPSRLGAALPTPKRNGSPRLEVASSTLDQAMVRHIENALIRARGQVEGPSGAAAQLAINPHTLRSRMRKLGIDWHRFRDQSPA
jgi:transcriptional regulator with GAF, ATPase, and Fis domain